MAAGCEGWRPGMLTRGRGCNAMSTSESNVPVFDGPDGLVTAVAQDAATGQVLMVAHMNREAWDETLATGRAVYYSRSRGRLWRKGEESGNIQHVRAMYVDCDGDAVLLEGRASRRRRLPRRLSIVLLPRSDAGRVESGRRAGV